MFPIRPRPVSTALTAAACAVALTGLFVSDAAAGHSKWKGRGHRNHDHRQPVVRIVERPAPRPYFSWTYARPAPSWCRDASYVVYDGDPYWYHMGLGVFVGGVDVSVDIGNTPPRGYGYWDPQCNEWFDDVRAYSTHCKRHDHRVVLQVVRWADDSPVCSCGHDRGHGDGHDDDDHDYDWR